MLVVMPDFYSPTYRKLLTLVAVGVFAGFVATLWFQQTGASSPLSWTVIGVSWMAGLIVYLLSRAVPRLPHRPVSLFGSNVSGYWLAIVVGLVLRLIVALVLAPQATSDGASYLALARQLVESGSYGSDGARAFWPPGLPLVLAPLLWVGLSSKMAMLLYGLLCFLATAWGMRRLAQRLELHVWSSIPVWLLALWPTHVLCTGLPEKELLVIALLPWIIDYAILAMRGSIISICIAGFLAGVAVLVQPSLQLLPIAAIVMAIILRKPLIKSVMGGVLGIVCMVVVIAPWTIRNYQLFDTPILVSTNGGDVLYRANNEKATGAYTPTGAIDLRHLDELSLDKESKRLAVDWIRSHPAEFVQLSMGKVLLFLGDDSYGAYASIRKGNPDIPNAVYLVVKLISAIPWLVIWFFILMSLRKPWPDRDKGRDTVAAAWLVLLPLLYLLAIHAIFESGPKYHLPVLGLVLVMFGYCLRHSQLPTPTEPSGQRKT